MAGPDVTLGDITGSKKPDTDFPDRVRYFFLSNGVSWQEFRKTPLPIIYGVLQEQIRINKEREENGN